MISRLGRSLLVVLALDLWRSMVQKRKIYLRAMRRRR